MSSKKVRIGVVGAGRWAQASHLPSLVKMKNVELAAISSQHYNSAVKAANQFNIKSVFKNWKELVNCQSLDALIILSPPITHYPISMAAFKKRKHVLCEGPLAMNYSQAAEMLKAAENNGLIHGYIRPKLYMDGGLKIKELIKKGLIGKIQNILITWRPKVWLDKKMPLSWRHLISQSPPLLSVVPAIILIDILGPVHSVCANYDIFVKKRYSEKNKRIMRVTAPDYFQAIFKSMNGAYVAIQAGAGDTDLETSGFQISGAEGTILWKWTLPNKILVKRAGDRKLKEIPYFFNFAKEWKFDRDFIKSILNESIPENNFNQGIYEMKVIDAIKESAEKKQWVCL